MAVWADRPPVTISLNDEAYIDDIPFNTAEVAGQKPSTDLSMFVLKEEAYIDDIPFDTKAIAGKLVIDKSLTDFSLQDEEYIDDIPFNTEAVARELNNSESIDQALAQNFRLKEEAYIDDIPFNTESVVMNTKDNKQSAVAKIEKAENSPVSGSEDGSVGMREIIIPLIVILGTLTFAFYERVLS
jgi:hypothetical protein